MKASLSLLTTIRGRMLFGSLALVLLPLVLAALGLGAFALQSGRAALQARAQEALRAQGLAKKQEVERYVDGLVQSMRLLAETREVIGGTVAMQDSFSKLPTSLKVTPEFARAAVKEWYARDFTPEYDRLNPRLPIQFQNIVNTLPEATIAVQYLYIATNPHGGEERYLLNDPGDGSAFSAAHAPLQKFMMSALAHTSFQDMHIADARTGDLFYTSAKEPDIATNLLIGPLKDTGMAEAFRAVVDKRTPDAVHMSEYASFYPALGEVSSFIGVPIMSGTTMVGVLIGQFPIDGLTDLVTYQGNWKDVGLGRTGETYLIGPDKKFRSNSRFLIENIGAYVQSLQAANLPADVIAAIQASGSNVGLQEIATEGALQALAGKTGSGTYPDYRSVEVLGFYAPIKLINNDWALLSEIDAQEAFAPVAELRNRILLGAVGAVALLGLVGAIFARVLSNSVTRPIDLFRGIVQKVNVGDLNARVRSNAQDEVGELSRAFDTLLDERVTTLNKASEENEQLNNSVIEIMQAVGRLAQRDLTVKVPVTADITGAVSDAINLMTRETANVLRRVDSISGQVASASNRVKDRSDQAMTNAVESRRQIGQASEEIQAAAAALQAILVRARAADVSAEETIRATRLALVGVRETVTGIAASRDVIREAEKRIKKLGERSQEISTAVSLISSIAERTGMLALNTSMQAVAAGEAGRAYAVVADEVKRLAESARLATQQIANLVSAIQSETVDTVEAINRAITQVVEISRTAEKAGEQMRQTEATTDQLVSTVREIARTTEEQAKVSVSLQARAEQIQNASRVTAEQMAEQSTETRGLLAYSNDLVAAVGVFNLPKSS